MGVFRISLLSYHSNDALIATGRMAMTTVTYGPLPQCLFVVVCRNQAGRRLGEGGTLSLMVPVYKVKKLLAISEKIYRL
jgi:hypothetical protein